MEERLFSSLSDHLLLVAVNELARTGNAGLANRKLVGEPFVKLAILSRTIYCQKLVRNKLKEATKPDQW